MRNSCAPFLATGLRGIPLRQPPAINPARSHTDESTQPNRSAQQPPPSKFLLNPIGALFAALHSPTEHPKQFRKPAIPNSRHSTDRSLWRLFQLPLDTVLKVLGALSGFLNDH